MNLIGKLLPKDGFIARLKEAPSMDYSKSLSHLYQPILGIEAVSLYHTLLNEAHSASNHVQTHHTLMNYLQRPLPEIYKLRLKLEGIGLLRTYKRSTEKGTIYTYEVQKPFPPTRFFEETMLSELLLHHVGKQRFIQLKNRFANEEEIFGKEITASFQAVFQTVDPKIQPKNIETKSLETNSFVELIDFSWLELMLKQRRLPVRKILTGENKKIISELTYLYNLATHEIEKAILWAITEEHHLDIEQLKEACHDLYATKSTAPIRLKLKQKEKQTQKHKQTKKLSREEQLIHRFETVSPRELLEDLSGGNRASERDLKIIRDVMLEQNLSQSVMNVLVHYVLIQSNMKLSKPYLETIASHWSRANLTTAKEAMDFAKEEIRRFKERQTNRTRRETSKEIIPDWFHERHKQPETLEEERIPNDEDIRKMLQRHASKK